jgi:unsaturated chondroitin disaccharide hydrolase
MYQSVEANAQWINETWEKIDRKLQKVCIRSRDKLPYTAINGVHDNMYETNPCFWTNGFWGGTMWLMYLNTKNEEYKTTALRSEQLLDKALEYYKTLHHDVGFLWLLTSVANYRITGNESACNKSLFTASTLFSRFNIEGNYIRAWNGTGPNHPSKTRTIIDTLMNLPLLYWASREIGDDRFAKVAMRHADMVIRDHIRPDGSVRHIVEHDEHTGELVQVLPGQGYSTESSWSRGVAWTVYGMALSYIHTKQQRYLDAAIRAADHFIAQCKKSGYLSLSDFYAPEEPLCYDATAGVCAACGMIEIAKALSGERGEYYMGEAIKILKATDAHFCNYSDDHDGLVHMGTLCYPRPDRKRNLVHVPIIYGDFFFVEAISKLKGNDFLIW